MKHELSQPQLAEQIGIEQSYLSKLENDKALPSNDILRALLQVFDMRLDQFVRLAETSENPQRLMQISDIDTWYKHRQLQAIRQQRSFVYTCSFLIVMGISLFYAGISKKVFSEYQYEYVSSGVVKPGEPDDILESWDNRIDKSDRDVFRKRKLEMQQRRAIEYRLISTFRGRTFIDPVEGGRRLFRFEQEQQVIRPVNAWLELIGVFIFSAGILGFVLESKFFAK